MWVSLLSLFTIVIMLFASVLSGTETKEPGSDSKRRKKNKTKECSWILVNVMLTPWQRLIWWFIAPKHVCMVLRYWPSSAFVSALVTTSLSWWKKDYRLRLMACMCADDIPCFSLFARTVDRTSISCFLTDNPSCPQKTHNRRIYWTLTLTNTTTMFGFYFVCSFLKQVIIFVVLLLFMLVFYFLISTLLFFLSHIFVS